jgi:glycosyltransferase involved in cell wall biosynthesis
MHPPVSLALIVRNEEAKLPARLESIADLAGEIIVVDTGSTDRTKDVAAGFGAKVFDFSWIDNSLLGKGPNPGPSVIDFAAKAGLPIYKGP